MNEKTLTDETILNAISGFQLLLFCAVAVFLIYLLLRKLKVERKEKFEKRDN